MSLSKCTEIADRYKHTQYVKRTIAPSGEPTAKKARLSLDPDVKFRCLRAISRFYFYNIIPESLDPYDVQVSNQIAGALKTVFHVCRQFVNNRPANKNAMEERSFKMGRGKDEVEVKFDTIEARWKAALKAENLGLTEPSDKMTPANQWTGVMAPYVAYCFGFNMRMKELRLGHHGYSVSSRVEGEERTPDGLGRVSKFGLEPRHHVLLEGCTFPPEIQSSMAQTLGSMTVCIKLATSNSSGIYTKKYEDAIERCFKHHPTIAKRIEKALIDAPVSASNQLIGKLGDLALLVPPRNQRRMFYPLHALAFFCLSSEEIKGLHLKVMAGIEPMETDTGSSSKEVPEPKKAKTAFNIVDPQDPKSGNAYEFDCSGKGALKCWTQYVKHLKPKMVGLEAEAEKLAQILFHSYWGTFSEDLGVLSAITSNKHWFTRSELGSVFQKGRPGAKLIEVATILFVLFSKAIAGNVSNHSEGQSGQLSHNPIFAGNRTVTYSEELTRALRKPDHSHNYSMDFNGLCEEIMGLIKKRLDDVGEDEQQWGNVEWKAVEEVEGVELFKMNDSTRRVACTGKYFLS